MASGGLSNVFISAFPAMYQLGLLGKSPKDDYLQIVGLTAVSGYFGFFFATPRKSNCYRDGFSKADMYQYASFSSFTSAVSSVSFSLPPLQRL
jgi:hypothetical protein